MRKQLFLLSLMVAIFVIASVSSFATWIDPTWEIIRVNVDGAYVEFDVDPQINQDNRTMVPIRFVAEELGFDVGWDHSTRTVTITGQDSYGENQELTLVIGKSVVRRKVGEDVKMDTVPVIIEDRTMVPVRFISEAMGMQVGWEPERRIVSVTSRPWSEGNDIHRDEILARGFEGFYKSPGEAFLWIKNPDGFHLSRGRGLIDIGINLREPTLEARRRAKEILEFFYPTGYEEIYDLTMQVARQEVWDFEQSPYPRARGVHDNRTFLIQNIIGSGIHIQVGTFGATALTPDKEDRDYSIHRERFFRNDQELQEYITKYDLGTH